MIDKGIKVDNRGYKGASKQIEMSNRIRVLNQRNQRKKIFKCWEEIKENKDKKCPLDLASKQFINTFFSTLFYGKESDDLNWEVSEKWGIISMTVNGY